MEYLQSRSNNIEPIREYEDIKNKSSLRIKLGIDPTASDVTLGWYAILRMLRKFQEAGHIAVLILGEFTAQVGDPSGKSTTRTSFGLSTISRDARLSGRKCHGNARCARDWSKRF